MNAQLAILEARVERAEGGTAELVRALTAAGIAWLRQQGAGVSVTVAQRAGRADE